MERLRRRAEFRAAATGARAPTTAFVLQVRQRDDAGPARVGLTISRQVGTAVERNRVRRRLREMVRVAAAHDVAPGHDYVLIARRAALTHPFDQLHADLKGALRRAAGHAQTGSRRAASRKSGEATNTGRTAAGRGERDARTRE